ncbi:MAG TPA: hypothetical protein VFK05_25435 [Polyangiaceae bacterium]|nr:hypothetical protein [Polyangiaceae bacterium]
MAPRALKALRLAPFLLAFVSLERRALAAPFPDTLSLQLSACPASEPTASAFADAIRSELEADGVRHILDAPGANSDVTLTVRIECDAALTAQVRFKVSGTGRERSERISLADAVPSARARALALALTELVRSSWQASDGSPSSSAPGTDPESQRPASPPTPEAQPEKPAPNQPPKEKKPPPAPSATETTASERELVPRVDEAAALRPASPRHTRAFSFAASAHLRWFIDYRSLLFGGELGADFRAFRLRTELLVASTNDELGAATWGSAALCLGYRVLDAQLGPVELAAYPMAALGLTWLRGDSSSASTRVDPATGFYGDLRVLLEAQLSRWPLAPALSLELGRATGFEARAANRILGSTGGFFFGTSVGARY